MVQRSFLLFLISIFIQSAGVGQNLEGLYRMRTIVVDAGHGGKDPGNLGTGRYKAKEKDIALDVALRVGGYIQKQFPEIDLIYTRSTDVFIGLNERADIANKAKADLFISIHCNAFPKLTSHGVETWVLGLHRNKENLQVAMKENSAIIMEDDYKTKYEGFDPNSAESIIALTIMQSAFLQQSLSLSSYIQKQFRERVGRVDRGVKQAGFLVLRRTTMPSVLIELGFLTNADEEDFLNSENGKAYMSSAIFRGFKEYKSVVEDPLPEGYLPPVKDTEQAKKAMADSLEQVEQQRSEEERKQQEEQARLAASEQARNDSIRQAEEQAELKASADSLAQAEQQRSEEEKKIQEEQIRLAAAEQAQKDSILQAKEQVEINAEFDSLAQVEQQRFEAEQQEKQEQARLAAAEKARNDSILQAKEQAEINAEFDSLTRVEQQRVDKEKKLQEEQTRLATAEQARKDSIRQVEEKIELSAAGDSLLNTHKKVETNEDLRMKIRAEMLGSESPASDNNRNPDQADLKATADSLELQKQLLMEQKKQREAEFAAEHRAREEEQHTEEEQRKQQLAMQAKEDAKEWLEEIKEEKQRELAEAKERVGERPGENEPEQVVTEIEQKTAEADSIPTNVEPTTDTDSMMGTELTQTTVKEVTIDNRKAVTAEEAEFLFLRLRKKELEDRIVQLTGRTVAPKVTTAKTVSTPAEKAGPQLNDAPLSGVVLAVQIMTRVNPMKKDSPEFKGREVRQYQQSGLYKYTVGATADFEEITKLQGELRNLGFKGAFVVAFRDGERIKVSEARNILDRQ